MRTIGLQFCAPRARENGTVAGGDESFPIHIERDERNKRDRGMIKMGR